MSLRRIFAAMALVLVLAPLAANAPLLDPDEGLHAAIAQEMNLRRDYVTPTFLGEPFLDKPILFFWAEALSLRVFGDREAAVRLPPLLFGVLGMIGVAALGRVLFGNDSVAWLAGMVYGTMLLPLGVSQVAVHDVAVVPFMCAACAWSFRAKAGAASSIVMAGVALGLSILTKGLVAVAFSGLLAIALAVCDRRNIVRMLVTLAAAGIVAVLVALPWYVAMEHAHPGYLHYYFIQRHLQGYLTATQRHAGRGWWYYLPIVIGGTLPWTGYLIAAARRARQQRMTLAVWAWFVLGFVFLSAGESKLITYALPLFPATAILAADAIVSGAGWRYRTGFATFAATLALLPAVALTLVAWRFAQVAATVWVMIGLITLAIAAVAMRIWRQPPASLTVETFRLMRLPALALFGLMIVLPRAAAWMTARDLAASLNGAGTLPSHVSVASERIGSLIFYMSPPLRAAATPERVDETTLAQAVGRIRTEAPDAIFAVRDTDVSRFRRLFNLPPAAQAHAGTFTIFRAGDLRHALGER
jgi:4-amino-4-deoxy-L-arabinose transferase-like glycosyltransferase